MAYVCAKPETWDGKTVGSGHCVAFVQEGAGAPVTAQWKEGKKVQDEWKTLASGTAIATFVDGKYPNAKTGNHAAIFVEGAADVVTVWDQWKGQAVHKRTIRFRADDWKGSDSNNASKFSVIE